MGQGRGTESCTWNRTAAIVSFLAALCAPVWAAKLVDVRPVNGEHLVVRWLDGQIEYKHDGQGPRTFMGHQHSCEDTVITYHRPLDVTAAGRATAYALRSSPDAGYAEPVTPVEVFRKTQVNGATFIPPKECPDSAISARTIASDAETEPDPAKSRPRVIIITDMTHDDGNSLIRYLHYANEFTTEAVVVTPQLPDFRHDSLQPWRKAQRILDAYGKVHGQLLRHDAAYPAVEEIRRVMKKGRGALPIIWLTSDQKFWDWIGDGNTPNGEPKDSEGSDFLQTVFEKSDPNPLFVQFWGGPITFMQALYRYQQKHTAEELAALLGKMHVYDIHFQDITVDMMISLNDMKAVRAGNLGAAVGTYGKPQLTPASYSQDNNHFWIYLKAMNPTEVNGHGPLSDLYDGGGEGDTPAILVLVSDLLGLNDARIPSHGSWGNMYHPLGGRFPPRCFSVIGGKDSELKRWMPDARNDFLARLDRGVKDPCQVNHPPKPVVNGDAGNRVMYIDAAPGTVIRLDASASIDPDGDALTFRWFHYAEADGYPGIVPIGDSSAKVGKFAIPSDAGSERVHVVLELRDNGTPPLVAYRRIIAGKGARDPFAAR